MTKNENIKTSLKATREKRKHQFCKVYSVKIDASHISHKTQEHLNRIFLEAKWFYNNILSDIFNTDDKIKEVPVKVKDTFETRELKCLSSQMKQSLIDRAKGNISGLSILKNKGKKVGKLKYTKEVKSIPLKQFGSTYRILESKTKSRYIAIQGIKQHLKVIGLNQIPIGVDFANATLIHRTGNYYLSITTYQEKEIQSKPVLPIKSIGIDFNIGKQLVLSNGIEIQYKIEITPKLKRIARKLSKQQKNSKNWYKTKIKLNKEYEYLTNIKQDIKNKIVSNLKNNVEIICFQDEPLKFWQSKFGSRIHSTSLGGIIASLKKRVHTPIEVDRFYPSTKTCSKCGNKQSVTLSERVYVCNKCNHIIDRDLNSAINIESEGLKNIGMVHTELTLVEIEANTLMLEYLNNIPHIKASSIYESGSLIALARGSSHSLPSPIPIPRIDFSTNNKKDNKDTGYHG